MFIFIVFFLKRGNCQTAKMEFIGMTRRTNLHGAKWLFNIGDNNEMRILIS